MTRIRPPTRRLLLRLAIVWFCASPAGAAETHESPYAGEHTARSRACRRAISRNSVAAAAGV